MDNDFLDNDFTRCMLFVTFGIVLVFLFILPLFENKNLPFLTPRKLTYIHENQEIPVKNLTFNKLPAIIYQSYNNSLIIDNDFIENLNNTIEKSPEFDIYLSNDSDSRFFIESNFDSDLLKIYDSLSIKQKNNLWIYCLLYRNGGVYIDISLQLTQPLLKIVSSTADKVLFLKDEDKISNKFISAPPGLPMFKELIDSYYTKNIQTLTYSVNTYHSDNIRFYIDNRTIRNIESNDLVFNIS